MTTTQTLLLTLGALLLCACAAKIPLPAQYVKQQTVELVASGDLALITEVEPRYRHEDTQFYRIRTRFAEGRVRESDLQPTKQQPTYW